MAQNEKGHERRVAKMTIIGEFMIGGMIFSIVVSLIVLLSFPSNRKKRNETTLFSTKKYTDRWWLK